MVKMQQVHGNNVVRVYKKDDGKTIENCDALITNEKDLELCVRVADCLPVSVVDKKDLGVGLIHAGWRGLEKQVISKTIKKMIEEFSVKPEYLEVKIGPHICKSHYEVGAEVSDKFNSERFLDLAEVAKQQLVEVGVKNITIDSTCTFEDEKLFSYRRGDKKDRNIYLLKI